MPVVMQAVAKMADSKADFCSFSDRQKVVTTKLSLDWDINFAERKIKWVSPSRCPNSGQRCCQFGEKIIMEWLFLKYLPNFRT